MIVLVFSLISLNDRFYNCCGATVGSEQQHNQDLREIYKGRRILEFITFYHNALHLTRGNSVVESVPGERASLLPRLRVSLWQIFYCTVRNLTKFKTRRSLSDEYDGYLGDWISKAFDSCRR